MAKSITFTNSSKTIKLSNDKANIIFKDSTNKLIFDLIVTDGFPFIFPFILT